VPSRIVLFGATGYTGRLTAEALVARGARPVLAARSAEKLESLAAELDPSLELAVADTARPETISSLLERGDVLVSTVGPFARFGHAALQAAIGARASYLDSTGEPAFAEVRLDGQNPYAFTAAILAWGAETAARRGLESAGAPGPVEAFGLDALEQGCRAAGLARV
jgi:short subunit dehydrogenase-like uncharacterized protein